MEQIGIPVPDKNQRPLFRLVSALIFLNKGQKLGRFLYVRIRAKSIRSLVLMDKVLMKIISWEEIKLIISKY